MAPFEFWLSSQRAPPLALLGFSLRSLGFRSRHVAAPVSFVVAENRAASCLPCCGSRETCTLVFLFATGTPTVLLFFSEHSPPPPPSPTALARSSSLIRVPSQLSVLTLFARRRAVRISLSDCSPRLRWLLRHTKDCSVWRTTPPVTGFLFESGSSQTPPVFD
jgi:hypothetical protein